MHRQSPVPLRWPTLERQALVLLIALLPTLTFAGHWDVPAMRDLVNGALPGGHSHSHHAHAPAPGSEHDHARHCHAGLASCTDVPFTGGSPVAHLREALADVAATAPLLPATTPPGPLGHDLATVSPGLQPPN